MKKYIFVIRHAESTANVNEEGLLSPKKKYVIDSGFGLTEKGRETAKEAGKRQAEIMIQTFFNDNPLFKDAMFASTLSCNMYVSPFERTRETAMHFKEGIEEYFREYSAKSLARLSTDISEIEDPRLVEQDYGDFDFQYMRSWPNISPHSFFINQARYHDRTGRFFARLENGENLLDVYNRVSLFVETRLERSKAKYNIVITHGNTQKIFKMYLLGEPIETFEDHYKAYPNLTNMLFEYDDEKGMYKLLNIFS